MFTLDIAEEVCIKLSIKGTKLEPRKVNSVICSAIDLVHEGKEMSLKYPYIALSGLISYNVPKQDICKALDFIVSTDICVLIYEIIGGCDEVQGL